jgi:hypothetical protein
VNGSVNEMLLYLGLVILAVVVFGFLLLRRGRQRPSSGLFEDEDDPGGGEGSGQVL